MIRLAACKLKPEHPQLSKKITETGKEPVRKKQLHRFTVFGIMPLAVKEHTAADPQDPDFYSSSAE